MVTQKKRPAKNRLLLLSTRVLLLIMEAGLRTTPTQPTWAYLAVLGLRPGLAACAEAVLEAALRWMFLPTPPDATLIRQAFLHAPVSSQLVVSQQHLEMHYLLTVF